MPIDGKKGNKMKQFFVLGMAFVLLTLAVSSVAAEIEPPPEDPRQPNRMALIWEELPPDDPHEPLVMVRIDTEPPPSDPREPSVASTVTLLDEDTIKGDIKVDPR
jgi:hypothetical protein